MDRIALVVLLLIFVLVLHLIEKVRTGFRRRLPVGEMPFPLFIGINVFIYSFCLVTFLLLLDGNKLEVGSPWVFAIGMLLNGIGHIGMMVVRQTYFPGGVTAILVVTSGSSKRSEKETKQY